MQSVIEYVYHLSETNRIAHYVLSYCAFLVVCMILAFSYCVVFFMRMVNYRLLALFVIFIPSLCYAGRAQFNQDLYELGTQAMSSSGNYLCVRNRCNGSYTIDLWNYNGTYNLVASRTGVISAPGTGMYIQSVGSPNIPWESGVGYGISYCSGGGSGYECGCTYLLENSTWATMGIQSFVDPFIVTGGSDTHNPYLGFYVCDATSVAENIAYRAYKLRRVNAMGEGDSGYYDISELPWDMTNNVGIAWPCAPINVPVTTTTTTVTTTSTTSSSSTSSTSSSSSSTSSTSTSTTSGSSSSTSSTSSTTTSTAINVTTTTSKSTTTTYVYSSTTTTVPGDLPVPGETGNVDYDQSVDVALDAASEIDTSVPYTEDVSIADNAIDEIITLAMAHPVVAAIQGSSVQVDSQDCDFTVVMFGRTLHFSFCEFQDKINMLGVFLLGIASIYALLIVSGVRF